MSLICLSLMTSGCSTTTDDPGGDGKVNYRTLGAKSVALDVPPDLTQLPTDNRFGSTSSEGVSTLSPTTGGPEKAVVNTAGTGIARLSNRTASLERAGQLRWLVSNRSPDEVWPVLITFWKESGFNLVVEDPATGLLETDWAENRAQLKEDFIRRSIGRVFSRLYDSGQRDRYIVRLEKTTSGSEIYIAHRGLEEVYTSAKQEDRTTLWRARPSDPQLEAAMLSKLLLKLGGMADPSPSASPPPVPPTQTTPSDTTSLTGIAQLLPGTDDSYTTVQINEKLDGAWRRVTVALNRAGYRVLHRNRQQAVIQVQAAPPTTAEVDSSKGRSKYATAEDIARAAKPTTPLRLQLRENSDKTTVQVVSDPSQLNGNDAARQLARALIQAL